MQPFDALTMRAVLQEARPLLLQRRVDKIYQLGRDEIVIALRLKTGQGYFLVSAQASFGRLCMVAAPQLPKHVNPPAFCLLLRKHLSGATITGVEQVPGERVTDITFACLDELGSKSVRVLTAEVMGRHSNLIFWDKATGKILGASHVVTKEMSRQREVAAGLPYARPPRQDKSSIFEIDRQMFDAAFMRLQVSLAEPQDEPARLLSYEHWLLSAFAGLGRHLADELVSASEVAGALSLDTATAQCAEQLWGRIAQMQNLISYRPAMRKDLSRYTVLSWLGEQAESESGGDWQCFAAVNDMIEEYFRQQLLAEQVQQLKDRIRSELKGESDRLESRIAAANQQLDSTSDVDQLKVKGDMIFAHLSTIQAGQAELLCDNLYLEGGGKLAIELNANLSASQNAQHYYRQFAKARVRRQTATLALADAKARMAAVKGHLARLEGAQDLAELAKLKELILDRGKKAEQKPQSKFKQQKERSQPSFKTPRLTTTKSSDGWLIYIGRNKYENDLLVSKIAQPADLWLHVLGQEGAHVVIKNPGKQDPPLATLQEAAQLAARFSRISLGSKVRVVYTPVKFVRKIGGKDKPGLVAYENEKTLEVDTSAPMPPSLRQLFAKS